MNKEELKVNDYVKILKLDTGVRLCDKYVNSLGKIGRIKHVHMHTTDFIDVYILSVDDWFSYRRDQIKKVNNITKEKFKHILNIT